jgi:hypothetical protein
VVVGIRPFFGWLASHLPIEVIDAIRKMLAGRVLVDLDEQLEIKELVAARARGRRAGRAQRARSGAAARRRERDLAVAMICQLVIAPASKLSMTRRVHQTTLADETRDRHLNNETSA